MRKKARPAEQEPLTGEKTIAESVYEIAKSVLVQAKENKKDIKQSSFALLLSVITGTLAGIFLGHAQETLLLLPGLIVLIPAALGMRGNIGAALGARLATALHLGTIDSFSPKNKIIRANIYSSITLSLLLSVFLAFFAEILTTSLGMPSMGIASFIAISVIGGMIAGVILVFITIITSATAYRRGWDLDNIHAPLITAFGDFFTIPSLLLATFIVQGFNFIVIDIAVIAVILAVLNLFYIFIRKDEVIYRSGSYKTIVMQSVLILAAAGAIDVLAGIMLESKVHNLTAIPILLVLLPVFLEEGGNIGNTLASRIGTKLHLGTLNTKLEVGKEVRKEFLISYILSIFIFPITGLLVYIFSVGFGIQHIGVQTMSLQSIVFISAFAGYILTTIIVIVTFLISIAAFKFGFDPDNVTLPLVTAIADVLGVISLLIVLSVFGI